jgi:GTP-binding protein
MFKDEAEIYVRAGKGGNGCVAFRREKYVPRGGPDGGDGGKGGDVVIRAAGNCNTLLHLAHQHQFCAEDGSPGRGKKCSGKSGCALIIKVPPGTIIRDKEGRLLKDLQHVGDEILIARGGKGGRGNTHFASPTNQVPREAELGQAGEEYYLRLELKLIADVGLVGFPNAGKSTLISRVSAARPKIADYPFTTLSPNLGIVNLPDYRTLVFADIPGIIEGAHAGVGLGDKFLKHIERTRVLVYVIDIAPIDKSDPVETFSILRKELASYSESLAQKDFVIAANKMDLTDAQENLQKFCEKVKIPVYPISAVTGEGVGRLLQAILEMIKE